MGFPDKSFVLQQLNSKNEKRIPGTLSPSLWNGCGSTKLYFVI